MVASSCSVINKERSRKYTNFRRGMLERKLAKAQERSMREKEKAFEEGEPVVQKNEKGTYTGYIGSENFLALKPEAFHSSKDKEEEVLHIALTDMGSKIAKLDLNKIDWTVLLSDRPIAMEYIRLENSSLKDEVVENVGKLALSDVGIYSVRALDAYKLNIGSNSTRLFAVRKMRKEQERSEILSMNDSHNLMWDKRLSQDFMLNNAIDGVDKFMFLIILILLPPLALFLFEGKITRHFWIDLLLFFTFYIPGLAYAIYMIAQ